VGEETEKKASHERIHDEHFGMLSIEVRRRGVWMVQRIEMLLPRTFVYRIFNMASAEMESGNDTGANLPTNVVSQGLPSQVSVALAEVKAVQPHEPIARKQIRNRVAGLRPHPVGNAGDVRV